MSRSLGRYLEFVQPKPDTTLLHGIIDCEPDLLCTSNIALPGHGHKLPIVAEKFIDFMLSQQFQEDLPMQMFVYPVNPDAALPDEFVQYAQIPDQPATLNPADIAANREQWIQSWTDTVLR